MNNISSNENKELLWNLLYENNFFKDIPNKKTEDVKKIFEECIINTESNIIKENYNIIEVNKLILKDIINKIKSLKKNNITTEYELLEQDFNNYNNLKKPKNIDFSDKIEEIDISNIQDINVLLENLQSERENNIFDLNNIDISHNNMDISNNNISFSNNNYQINNLLKEQNFLNQEYKYENVINFYNKFHTKFEYITRKIEDLDKKIENLDNKQTTIINLLNKKN